MGIMRLTKVLIGTVAFGLPVSVTLIDLVGYVATVEGLSMQPLLNPVGQRSMDFVLLNKWAIRNYDIKRGEIVSLISPSDPDQRIIKRIVALEGDQVIPQPFSRFDSPVQIPEGYCWVEGDNHKGSLDSNRFGPVPLALITAKATYIVWPPSRWQKLKSSRSTV